MSSNKKSTKRPLSDNDSSDKEKKRRKDRKRPPSDNDSSDKEKRRKDRKRKSAPKKGQRNDDKPW